MPECGSARRSEYWGRLVQKCPGLRADGTRLYAYDALNRLKTVTRKSDDETIATYSYDALGRRIRKEVENGGIPEDPDLNGTTDYLYAGVRCLEERDPFGGEEEGEDTPLRQYVWGLYVAELIQQREVE
jgi:YD repeat-containing protein